MAATKALRVVSYNVQRWGRFDAVIDTLSRLRPDVLCLQECCQKRGPGALQKVADACGLKQVHFFGHTMDESYGNAILDAGAELAGHGDLPQGRFYHRRPPHPAGRGVIQSITPARRRRDVVMWCRGPHRRGALFVEMGTIRVCCTHLDHISENERAIQAGGLVRQLHDLRGDAKAMLLVGDLNALNDEAKWDRLDAIHEENGWAPPEDSTVPGGALHTFLENGWVDVSRGAGLSSPASPRPPSVDRAGARARGCQARADGRVGDGSDHLPVVVEVEVPAICGTCARLPRARPKTNDRPGHRRQGYLPSFSRSFALWSARAVWAGGRDRGAAPLTRRGTNVFRVPILSGGCRACSCD